MGQFIKNANVTRNTDIRLDRLLQSLNDSKQSLKSLNVVNTRFIVQISGIFPSGDFHTQLRYLDFHNIRVLDSRAEKSETQLYSSDTLHATVKGSRILKKFLRFSNNAHVEDAYNVASTVALTITFAYSAPPKSLVQIHFSDVAINASKG